MRVLSRLPYRELTVPVNHKGLLRYILTLWGRAASVGASTTDQQCNMLCTFHLLRAVKLASSDAGSELQN